jgi:hypothetical protein
MNRWMSISTLALMAVALALPVQAQRVPTTQPGPHAAHVSGVLGLPAQELYAVYFQEVNGVSIQPREELWLEPGSYTLTVLVDATHARSTPHHQRRPARGDARGYNRIELELEAGKSYEIRARYDRTNRDQPYTVVLYKVSDQ